MIRFWNTRILSVFKTMEVQGREIHTTKFSISWTEFYFQPVTRMLVTQLRTFVTLTLANEIFDSCNGKTVGTLVHR